MIRLFISHSSRDEPLAALLVELFRAGLELSPSEIRCTSVDGYRLPIGADTDDQLRDELLQATSFLGLISEAALGSSYVLFELGARWGARLHIAPLLAPGVDVRLLPAPISGKTALRADRAEDLQQMLVDIASSLEVESKNAPLVQKYIGAILRHNQDSPQSRLQDDIGTTGPPIAGPATPPDGRSRGLLEAPETAEAILQRTCSARWPQDFRMQAHCIEQQQAAYRELSGEPPADLPIDVYVQLRQMCHSRWPDDFRMRLHCEGQQIQAWRDLSSARR